MDINNNPISPKELRECLLESEINTTKIIIQLEMINENLATIAELLWNLKN